MIYHQGSLPNQSHAIEESSKISIKLKITDFKPFLDYLVINQIPFETTFQSQPQTVEQKFVENTSTNFSPVVNNTVLKSISTNSLSTKKSNLANIIREIHKKYVDDNIEKIPPTEVQIAMDFNIKLSALKVGFKNTYGKSFYQCYLDRKMEYSSLLLRKGFRASEISARLGYSHPVKFNKMFQKHFGITPKKYQDLKKNSSKK